METESRNSKPDGCRFCGSALVHTFVDLGMSPPCQTHIEKPQLGEMERFYPLHAFVCEKCFLVQLKIMWRPTIFLRNMRTFRHTPNRG